MFRIEENTIHITRGDVAGIKVTAKNQDGSNYTFNIGDMIRFKVFEKNKCENIKIQKDVGILEETEIVEVILESSDTKIDDLINKPKDYWYEVELNPDSAPQTILGYDDDGAKIFKIYPEGSDINE